MDRRTLFTQGLAASSLLGAGALVQAAGALANPSAPASAMPDKMAKLLESSSRCVTTGLVCIKHCQKELQAGRKMMAECLQSVLELVAVCESLMELVSLESAFVKDFAKLSAKVCAECAKICEKHSSHMEACKACMEACRECEKACLAL